MLAGQERRQHPQLTWYRPRLLPPRQSQWADRTRRHRGLLVTAAAERPQAGIYPLDLSGNDIDGVRRRFGLRAGRPGVANLAAKPTSTAVVDQQAEIH